MLQSRLSSRGAAPGVLLLLALSASLVPRSGNASSWQTLTPLPAPVSNNAVAIFNDVTTSYLYSFMGIDTTKTAAGISRKAWRLDLTTGVWSAIPDVPGSVGRIASLAFSCGGKLYLMGGYSVAPNGSETTWGNVDIFDPVTGSWSAGSPIPVPVDDMVGGVWRDSLIYLVCGWSQTANVQNTQVYNPATNTWAQATPFPIEGTFGGAGGIVGNWIVYADGVKGNFLIRKKTHRGWIDPANPTSIAWNATAGHPGPGLYRMAAGNVPGDTTAILFAGGSDNPYNFDAQGYNGQPSEPTAQMWLYFAPTAKKLQIGDKAVATMDHRTFPSTIDRMFIAGGMVAGGAVTDMVQSYIPDQPTGVADRPVGVSPKDIPALLAFPNPARRTAFFAIDDAGEKRSVLRDAAVYDASGRLVRSFAGGAPGASSRFEWDLLDDEGRRVPAGVYFIRGNVFDRHMSRKITVID